MQLDLNKPKIKWIKLVLNTKLLNLLRKKGSVP